MIRWVVMCLLLLPAALPAQVAPADGAQAWLALAERIVLLEGDSSQAAAAARAIADSLRATTAAAMPAETPAPLGGDVAPPAPLLPTWLSSTRSLVALCAALLLALVLLRRQGTPPRVPARRTRTQARVWSASALLRAGRSETETARQTGLGRDALGICRRVARQSYPADSAVRGINFRPQPLARRSAGW
jgi:hypothetical protein